MPHVGYCLACGMLRDLACGKCAQCRKDDAVRAARRGRCRNGASMANPPGGATQGDPSQGARRNMRPAPRPDVPESMGTCGGAREEGSPA